MDSDSGSDSDSGGSHYWGGASSAKFLSILSILIFPGFESLFLINFLKVWGTRFWPKAYYFLVNHYFLIKNMYLD